MRRVNAKRAPFAWLAIWCLAQLSLWSQSTPLKVSGNKLELYGKTFQIISGEMEYARVPRDDWRDRLRKVKAMGLNTIAVYVFWNLHEPAPGIYDFKGQNDVAEYLREAQQEGLYVVLRPGPYVCAEWDLGGYPAWLLRQSGEGGPAASPMMLRSTEESYLKPVRRWMKRLGQELAPLQASRGGPIIAVQVENEYGSFQAPDAGGAYMRIMEQIVRDAGFGESMLYTGDGAEELKKGALPNLPAAIDFGTGSAEHELALLHRFRPDGPLFVAEYWDGWFDHWGENHQVTDAGKQEAEIRQILEQGGSINLYMVHGGTSFGWMNGANWDTDNYQPDTSSYDYDAPLDETGRPRAKYFAMRKTIADLTHRKLPPVPDSPPLRTLPELILTDSKSLWSLIAQMRTKNIGPNRLLSMEDLGQNYGYVVYRHLVTADEAAGPGLLRVEGLHSYARVFLDGVLAGAMDRRLQQSEIKLAAKAGQTLDVLVENAGRINFTVKLRGERAGIVEAISLNGHPLNIAKAFSLPLDAPPAEGYRKQDCSGPCFYRGALQVLVPGDTYLNTERLSKGVVWVNGHLLGRYWNVGPIHSLYIPGVWMHAGANTIVVLDLDGGRSISVHGDDHPVYRDVVKAGAEQANP